MTEREAELFEPFCRFHVIIEDDNQRDNCFVRYFNLPTHLLDKMGVKCPYVDAAQAQTGQAATGDEISLPCPDFKPRS